MTRCLSPMGEMSLICMRARGQADLKYIFLKPSQLSLSPNDRPWHGLVGVHWRDDWTIGRDEP